MNGSQPGGYIDEQSHAPAEIAGAPTSIAAFLGRAPAGPPGIPQSCESIAGYERTFGPVARQYPLSGAVADFFANGGTHAFVTRLVHAGDDNAPLDDADVIGDREARTGLYALEAVDLFNLLYVAPDAPGADAGIAALRAAASYCAERRALLVLDPPASWTAAAERGDYRALQPAYFGFDAVQQRNAAVFFPRIVKADPGTNGATAASGAGGAIAGVFARVDASHGVWHAGSGTGAALAGVTSLEVMMNDAQSAVLSTNGVNALRSFPHVGPVVWGSTTLHGGHTLRDEWKYVSVRRLMLFLEESIDRGTRWVVFEPNGEPLWARLRDSVNGFLRPLAQRRAFHDYFVKIDRTTMTQDDLDNGRLVMEIGIAPVRPAEYVIIRIGQWLTKPDDDP